MRVYRADDMVEPKISMKLEGEKSLAQLGLFLRKGSIYTKHFWNAVKGIVWRQTGRKFRQGGGEGGKWEPLSPATLITRRHGGSAVMQDTGRLLRSVTGRGRGTVVNETPKSLEIGTNLQSDGVSYPRVLQEGATITVTKRMKYYMMWRYGLHLKVGSTIRIPPRPFLYVDSRMKNDIGKAAKTMINVIIKGGVK